MCTLGCGGCGCNESTHKTILAKHKNNVMKNLGKLENLADLQNTQLMMCKHDGIGKDEV